MYVADSLSCYVHLAEACNGDPRIVDVFDLAISRWGGDDVEKFLRLACSVHSKEGGGHQETSVTFRHRKWFCPDDNITCVAEEVVVKNQIFKNKMSKVKVKSKGQTVQKSKVIWHSKISITRINKRIQPKTRADITKKHNNMANKGTKDAQSHE